MMVYKMWFNPHPNRPHVDGLMFEVRRVSSDLENPKGQEVTV